MGDTVLFEDDLGDTARTILRRGGREWIFEYTLASTTWVRRYTAQVEKRSDFIRENSFEAYLEALDDLTEEVLGPPNHLDRAAIEHIQPEDKRGLLMLFVNGYSWGGTEMIRRLAEQANATRPQPAPEVAQTPATRKSHHRRVA